METSTPTICASEHAALWAKFPFQIPDLLYASFMQIINNAFISCDKNYVIIFEQNVQQRFQQLIMNWDLKAFRRVWTESRRDFYIKRQEIFQSAFVLGSEVGSVPEIISVLIIPVRKCGKQIVPHWAQHGVNGLIAKEKQGNLLSSTC